MTMIELFKVYRSRLPRPPTPCFQAGSDSDSKIGEDLYSTTIHGCAARGKQLPRVDPARDSCALGAYQCQRLTSISGGRVVMSVRMAYGGRHAAARARSSLTS